MPAAAIGTGIACGERCYQAAVAVAMRPICLFYFPLAPINTAARSAARARARVESPAPARSLARTRPAGYMVSPLARAAAAACVVGAAALPSSGPMVNDLDHITAINAEGLGCVAAGWDPAGTAEAGG